jgi:hypothetical protein
LRFLAIFLLVTLVQGQVVLKGKSTLKGNGALTAYTNTGLAQFPQVWVDNNELTCGWDYPATCQIGSPGLLLTAPAYTLTLGAGTYGGTSGSWSPSAPCSLTTLTRYAADSAGVGLQNALNDLESCRTTSSRNVGFILVIPPGSYQNAGGFTIPQSASALATASIIVRSTSDSTLRAKSMPVCAGGIQDNLTESTAPGIINTDCQGGSNGGLLAYQTVTAGSPALSMLSGSFTLANGTATSATAYNYVQYMPQLSCTASSNCIPLQFCTPPALGGNVNCTGTIGPDHWEFQDMAFNIVGNEAQNIISCGASAVSNSSQNAWHIHFRRVWVHGDWQDATPGTGSTLNGTNLTSNAFAFTNCAYASIGDSQTSQLLKPANEGHVVIANGPGPFKFYNNWFEGQSSSIFSGGFAATPVLNYVPFSNVQIERTRLTFPIEWIGLGTVPNGPQTGKSLVRKNCMEPKEGQYVLFYGVICENVDNSGGQNGINLYLTVRNQSGGGFGQNYFAATNNWNVLSSIFRNSCRGINIDGRSVSVSGDGGGGTYPLNLINLSNILQYGVTASGTIGDCGSGAFGIIIVNGGGGQSWTGTVTSNSSAGTSTFTATHSIDAGAANVYTASITATSATSNVVTATANNSFLIGEQVILGGLNETVMNGKTVTVLSGGLSSSQFEFNFTIANYSGSESGATANGLAPLGELDTITATSMSSSTCTAAQGNTSGTTDQLTITATNTAVAGESLLLNGLTTSTFLNGQTVVVMTPGASSFIACGVNHAAYGTTADTGTAIGPIGFETMQMYAGDPAGVLNCSGANATALNLATKTWGASEPYPWPSSIQARVTVPPTAWSGTYASGNTTVTYSWTTTGNPGDTSGTCILTNSEGGPNNLTFNHMTFLTDAIQSIGEGPSLAQGPQFTAHHTLGNSIVTTGGGTNAAWSNTVLASPEGNPTETFDNDVATMNASYLVWTGTVSGSGRTASKYYEYPNNSLIFPDLSCITSSPGYGAGPPPFCNSPNSMFFPATAYCTASTYSGSGSNCVAFTGAMSLTSGPMPLFLADYHGFELRSDSPYHNAASDGTDMGVIIPNLDTSQTTSTAFSCPIACPGPGPFAD